MKVEACLLVAALAAGVTLSARAQEMPSSPPKVLQVTVEMLKPGKAGAPHDRTESAFVGAMRRAQFPTHYIALNSMSGASRALYLSGYPSFAAWEKDNKTVESKPSLEAELDHAATADGELLSEVRQLVFTYDEGMSYHPHADISGARYFEITVFQVRPGKGKEWRELARLVKDAHEKGHTSAHWAMFEIAYGAEDATYIAISTDKAMEEIDTGLAESKQFVEGLGGEEGMAKFRALVAESVASMRTELFSVNPRQSYVDEAWIKADPAFWKPKMPMAAKPAKAAEAKPAAP
jgi:hypothetical protein